MERKNEKALLIIREVQKAVIGKEDCIIKIMAAMLAGGHILLNDIPGVGKTTMAMAFAKAMDLETKRIQFTPDVLPSDVLGFSVYEKESGSFRFCPGPIFCNLLLADELNRTSPKTQSALLEAMEEGRASVEGKTRQLPEPFLVIATQNPCGSAGTQLLPDSQMDRFLICLSVGYPMPEDEISILKGEGSREKLKDIVPVLGGPEVLAGLRKEADEIYMHDEMYEYILNLVTQTRNHPMIELGISPRGGIAVVKMAKAMAFLRGRHFVVAEDVEDIFMDTAVHRLVLTIRARTAGKKTEDIISEILKKVKKPTIRGNYGRK
jgi:MoxR-like ATPase